MNSCTAILLALALSSTFALGDSMTPFVDHKSGEEVTGFGYVLEGSADGKFMVLVTSDTLEHFLVVATAKKGVVKRGHLGRPARVKGRVLKSGDPHFTQIEILKVTVVKRDEKKRSPR